jgi:hypothetical protein
MSPLYVTSAGTVSLPQSRESLEFVRSTNLRCCGPPSEVEPGATPLSALCSTQGSLPVQVWEGSSSRNDAIDAGCCHRARRRQGFPSWRSAAMPPLTPPPRGTRWHLSMALVVLALSDDASASRVEEC